MAKIERKMRAHFIDGSLTATPSYYWIGDDIDDFSIAMNPEFESKANIKGVSSTQLKGYDPQASIDPYYADDTDEIYDKLNKIYKERSTGDDCKTTYVEVEMNDQIQESGSPIADTYTAKRWDAVIVLQEAGGDTAGFGFKFDVKISGNPTEGKFNTSTKTFTANA